MVTPYVREAKIDNRNLVYIRFGRHKPIVADDPDIKTFNIEPGKGFELFANEVHNIIKGAGGHLHNGKLRGFRIILKFSPRRRTP